MRRPCDWDFIVLPGSGKLFTFNLPHRASATPGPAGPGPGSRADHPQLPLRGIYAPIGVQQQQLARRSCSGAGYDFELWRHRTTYGSPDRWTMIGRLVWSKENATTFRHCWCSHEPLFGPATVLLGFFTDRTQPSGHMASQRHDAAPWRTQPTRLRSLTIARRSISTTESRNEAGNGQAGRRRLGLRGTSRANVEPDRFIKGIAHPELGDGNPARATAILCCSARFDTIPG